MESKVKEMVDYEFGKALVVKDTEELTLKFSLLLDLVNYCRYFFKLFFPLNSFS